MIVAERLRARIEEMGHSQSSVARAVGISQASVAKLIGGQAYGSKHLHKIAQVLATTPAYLTGEADDPSLGALPAPTPEVVAEQLDLSPVEELSIEFGMGATFLVDHVETVTRWLPREWLGHFSTSPAHFLKFARGRGDSMYPTINNGDLVLIDTNQTRMTVQDEIWAVGYGDLGGLKRLRAIGDGQVKIMSDNPMVSDEIVSMDEIRIIGRVCANLRKM